jgi:hypothetical protein
VVWEDGGGNPASYPIVTRVLDLGDRSSLQAVVSGIARLGQGFRREADSEGSRRPTLEDRNWMSGHTTWVTR